MINVLVVDDSAFFRTALSHMLTSDPEIKVIGTARDGNEALDQVKKLKPDVVTMDVDMPKRDGISSLQGIMAECPTPVIMVSSLTQEGAEATLKALEYGALDFIPKYQQGESVGRLDLGSLSAEVCEKVKAVAHRMKRFPLHFSKRNSSSFRTPAAVSHTPQTFTRPSGRQKRDFVAIGVSTGGPPAVQKLLSALPADFPACIFIAQHMPASFTGPFARRLDGVSKITVKEAETGDKIQNGFAYVCPGGKHLRVDMRSALPHLSIVQEPTTALYKPSANVLMESVGMSVGPRAVGVMMTGMGSDGVEGAKVLKAKGGYMIAQNEASCVVYGMPKAVVDAGLANEVVDLESLPETIQAALYK